MRIDFHYGPHAAPESNRTSPQNGTNPGNPVSRSATGEDQAQLSGAQVQVAALAAQAVQLPETREERVQALRAALDSGQYHADAEKVAGGMLTHMISGPAA